MERIAVIGSGIAGLGAARALSRSPQARHVTLFEAAEHSGGHAHTVDVTLNGIRHGVDTGFLVYNEHTYPHLTALFAELDVQTTASEMSFSVQVRPQGLEWCGSDVAGVFAQRRNLVRPAFWGMLADIVRFNHLATRDGSVVHLGDNTTGKGEGDDEVITVDLGRVYPRVDSILFMVSSYQGHSLEFVRNAYCRLVDHDGTELARFTLTLGVRETGLVMAKLFRAGEVWKLRTIGTGIALKTPTDSIEALVPFVR